MRGINERKDNRKGQLLIEARKPGASCVGPAHPLVGNLFPPMTSLMLLFPFLELKKEVSDLLWLTTTYLLHITVALPFSEH